MRNFFTELKRRSVYKVAVAYTVVAWLLIQVATQVFPFLQIPDWAIRLVIMLLALGFPIALVIAWAFELTPEGLKRTETAESLPARKRDHAWIYIVVIGLVLSVGLFFLGRYTGHRGHSAGAPTAKSIAVLPFESLSEDKANAYFANGIQDEILTRLAKIADLKVISRTSTQQYQSKPGNLPEIAKQLGVAHILEGSVQKSGDAVRVNVQLIKAEGDSHLWAETYDRKLTDIFAVESEVAQKIAGALEAQLTGRERQQIAAVPTTDPEAYDAYLRGIELLNRQDFEEVRKGRDFLRQAVALDPSYAQAWAQIAIAESQIYFSEEHTPAGLERARQAADTAVRLRPELSEARAALGIFYYLCLQDFDRALIELNEARKHSPNDGNVLFYIGLVKRRQGKLDESIAYVRKAAAFDPRNQDIWVNLARSYRGKRDFHSARAAFDHAFAISPDEVQFIREKAETFAAEGNLEAAEKLLRQSKLQRIDGAPDEDVELLVYHRRFAEAVTAASQALARNKNRSPIRLAHDKSWLGGLQLLAGQEAEGRANLTEARREMIALREAGETGLRLADGLLLTSAALDDRPAVDEQAAALLQRTKNDLWRAPESKEIVAMAYASLGDADQAIPLIEQILNASYARSITPALLRLNPIWDEIRREPRFQKLAKARP
ncbi:MAG: tetratricopeptide repeat protein [Verrucomicrobiota bacterium]|nr:tetratricopeptide repeat protein [Verrucomicrobiota bacterium]